MAHILIVEKKNTYNIYDSYSNTTWGNQIMSKNKRVLKKNGTVVFPHSHRVNTELMRLVHE